jgi:uncharacterized membrane protein
MESRNPYAAPETSGYQYPGSNDGPRRISIGPIEALSRGYQLLGDQYLLFVGISFVAMLLGSMVPLGIIMGPMMVGIYFCCIERENGRTFDFNTLFRGFDMFMESFVAQLIMVGIYFVVGMVLGVAILVVWVIGAFGQAAEIAMGGLIVLLVISFLLSALAYVPFLLIFQLIADKRLSAMDAIRWSARGAWLNFGSILVFFIVAAVISVCLTLMCYIPVFFFLPIWFAATFVMYREIYPLPVVEARLG